MKFAQPLSITKTVPIEETKADTTVTACAINIYNNRQWRGDNCKETLMYYSEAWLYFFRN